MPSSALEAGFPSEQLHPLAELESWRKEVNRPPYHVHKWWANRLGSVFRAITLAANLDPDADIWAEFYKPHDFRDRIVLDPFMGSGTTVGEALKLGCRAVGCDINAVSYFQVRKAIEPCPEAELLAAYDRLEKQAAPKIRHFYSSQFNGVDAEILYTFWVKVLRCPDCGHDSRLFRRWIFSSNAYPKKKPESKAVCPCCGAINGVLYEDTSASCSECGHSYNPNAGPADGQYLNCEACHNKHRIVELVRQVQTVPEHRMYAMMLLLPNGQKAYKRPDASDLALYSEAEQLLKRSRLPIPPDEIPPGHNTNQARGYNYRHWRQMFNSRQLLCLGTLLRHIIKEPCLPARDNLLLLFSGMLEFNNMFCSFKGEGTGAVRHLFHHHILKPERTPLEANPWGTDKSSGSFSTLFHRRLLSARTYCDNPFELAVTMEAGKPKGNRVYDINRPIRPVLAESFSELASGKADAMLICGDSSQLKIPNGSIDYVITDPPYFDNVHYSELADFFYCWLREGLQGRDSAFAAGSTRSEREVQGTDSDSFAKLLGNVFHESARVLKPKGTVAFTFHHSRTEAWVAVAKAIEFAGLEVVAAHPIKAEMSVAVPKQQAKEPINLDLVIVCKHRTAPGESASDDGLSGLVKQATQRILKYNSIGFRLSRGDIRVVLMGVVLVAHTHSPSADIHAMMAKVETEIDGIFGRQQTQSRAKQSTLAFTD